MTDRRRPNVRDSNGDPIRPGAFVTFRGRVAKVSALYRDSGDDTDVSIYSVSPAGPLSTATDELRAKASDLTLVRP